MVPLSQLPDVRLLDYNSFAVASQKSPLTHLNSGTMQLLEVCASLSVMSEDSGGKLAFLDQRCPTNAAQHVFHPPSLATGTCPALQNVNQLILRYVSLTFQQRWAKKRSWQLVAQRKLFGLVTGKLPV